MTMSQICSSEVLVRNSPVIAAAVIAPLKDGLCSINKLYEVLIDGDVDPITGQFSNYKQSRELIVQAKKNLDQSEQAANTGLKCLDDKIEVLTQEEGKCEREMRDTKQALDNLRTEQKSNETSLKQSEGALEQARKTLSSTRDILQSQEERKRTAEIVTGVGAGVLFVPFVGWIAGPAMMIGGGIEIAQASNAVTEAEEEVRRAESEVEKYRSKVSECEGKIFQTTSGINQKHDKVEQIRKEIQKMTEQRQAVAEFQQKVREAVNILSVLNGKASVAEIQTRRFILKKPVMKVMEDLMKAAGRIAGNQLLSDEEIPKLLNAMKENNRKLAAICASPSSDEDEGYY